MALEVKASTRQFVFKKNGDKIHLTDIPGNSPTEVLDFYAATYPELTTARVEGPYILEGGDVEYRFVTHLGTKG